MSNIYIQEPPTNGKVLLKTTVGDVDIELWSKETPKAARNFVQLCLEGYYDGTAFHRVVKEFIVQGGDPTDSGDGGESVYGSPFKDEFHQRLRFVRRGLVAMANAGQHDNGSQFFFTMAATPELQNKHTIFGKVVGDTLFNMLKLQEVEVNEVTEKPVEPHRILSTEVLNNPFDDIVPRQIKRIKKDKEDEKKIKSKSKATKNFSLLSFGDEAEDDEEQVDKATESFRGKSKSSHDLTDDPRLSSIPAVEKDLNAEEEKRKKKLDGTPEDKAKRSPDTEDRETKVKTEVAEDEAKKKAEPAEEAKKGKTDVKEEEKKKKQPDTPERPEKKKSPAMAEEDSPKKKTEGEEEARKTVTKEEPKEESKTKKKPEPETTPPESRKRKAEDGQHKEERKKRSKEREDEERKKRKADSKEEEGRKKRKGEEERKKTEEEKGEVKKKGKTEPAETSTQPTPEEKTVKEEGEARKVKKEKEDTTSRGKEPEGRSLLGSSEESKQQRMEELKKEQRKLQRDIKDFKKRAHDKVKVKTEEPEEAAEEKVEEEVEDNDLLAMVKKERQKYKLKKKELGHRDNREADTLAMLAKFQTKLTNARTLAGDYDDDMDDEEKNAEGEEEEEDDPADMSWMRHKLHFEDQAAKSRVMDANVHDDERYSISDPRNPLTQRRRETSKKSIRDKR